MNITKSLIAQIVRHELAVLRGTATNKCGFTLVELLVVCAILIVLSTMALSGFSLMKEQARVARCVSEIRGLERDIGAYAVENGAPPPNLAKIGKDTLKDPWGNLYVYQPFVLASMRYSGVDPINTDYDIYSKGPDGLTDLSIVHNDSLDDIIRGNDGGYAGLAAKF